MGGGGVRIFNVFSLTSALKDRWRRVSLEDDFFFSWQDFVLEGKFKWPILESFTNLKFDNESLKSLYLCLYAPKLDKNETA